jgi:hypothetical protein
MDFSKGIVETQGLVAIRRTDKEHLWILLSKNNDICKPFECLSDKHVFRSTNELFQIDVAALINNALIYENHGLSYTIQDLEVYDFSNPIANEMQSNIRFMESRFKVNCGVVTHYLEYFNDRFKGISYQIQVKAYNDTHFYLEYLPGFSQGLNDTTLDFTVVLLD